MQDTQRKNIIVCADGTGNTTIKDRGTNVFKLYEAVDQNGHRKDSSLRPQLAIYHDGVGTETLKWLRIFSGATGFGLSHNVRNLYASLSRVYRPGDDIYLFGFSRGAFTVRTLAGLILGCGILDADAYKVNEDFVRAVRQAYRAYRSKYRSLLFDVLAGPVRRARGERAPVPLNLAVTPQDARVRFIGVWDTVDAVGAPFNIGEFINRYIYAFKFRTTTLDRRVECGRHALALDEEREAFTPVLWDETGAPEGKIKQVWFAGVHSNVGGGYPRQGMSLEPLEWMMAEAHAEGLRFVSGDRENYYIHADVNDKMYDPRAGLGIFYRWQPRDVDALRNGIASGPALVHRSVFERITRNTEGYVPGSIPPELAVVSSSMRATDWRVRAIEAHIFNAHGGKGSLVSRNRSALRLGQVSYWSLLLATLIVAVAGLLLYVNDEWNNHSTLADRLGAIVGGFFKGEWVGRAAQGLWAHPLILGLGGGLLVLAYALQLWIDRKLDREYSQFWHPLRMSLRSAPGLQMLPSQSDVAGLPAAADVAGLPVERV
jgi:uncharacterized protein (DUF2235 family)